MADELRDRQLKLELEAKRAKLYAQIQSEAENLNITLSDMDVLTAAILESVITTSEEYTAIVAEMEKGGASAKEIANELETKLANLTDKMNKLGGVGKVAEMVVANISDGVDMTSILMSDLNSNTVTFNNTLDGVNGNLGAMQNSVSGVSDAIATAGSLLEPFNILTEKVANSAAQIGNVYGDTGNIIENIMADSFDLASSEDGRSRTLSESLAYLQDNAKMHEEEIKYLENKTKMLEEILDSDEARAELSSDESSELKKQIALNKDILTLDSAKLDLTKSQLAVLKDHGETYKMIGEGAHNAAASLQGAIEGFLGRIPGGGFVSKKLGLNKLTEEVDGNLNKSFGEFVNMVSKDGSSAFKALRSSTASFGRGLYAALGPLGIALGVVAALGAALISVEHTLHDISHEFGVSHDVAKKIYKQSARIQGSLSNRLSTSKEILGVMSEMVSINGLTVFANDQVISQLSDIGKAIGHGSAMASQFHMAMVGLGAEDQAAANMQLLAANAAEAAGFSSQLIIKDVIDGAQELGDYFAGMPDKLIKAAIETRKMGINLKTASKIADSLLDIESSLTAQFEASAVLGRQINFDKARQLAFEGKLAEAGAAVLDQLGTRAEWERMTVFERRLAAKAAGMEVSEINRAFQIRSALSKLTSEEQDKYKDIVGQLENAGDLSQAELRTRLGHLSAMDEASAKWDKIKGQLMQAILPLVSTLGDLISALLPAIEPIVGIIKLIGKGIKLLSPIFKGLILPFQMIGSLLETVMEFFDDSVEVGTSLNTTVDNISHNFHGLAEIIGGAFGFFLGVPLLASGKFGKMFKFLFGMFGKLGKGIMRLLGLGSLFKGAPAKAMQKNATKLAGSTGGLFSKFFSKGAEKVVSNSAKIGATAGTQLAMNFGESAVKAAPKSTSILSKVFGKGLMKNMSGIIPAVGAMFSTGLGKVIPKGMKGLDLAKGLDKIKSFKLPKIDLKGNKYDALFETSKLDKFKNAFGKFTSFSKGKLDDLVKVGSNKFAKLKEAAKITPDIAKGKLDEFIKYGSTKFDLIKKAVKLVPSFATDKLDTFIKYGQKNIAKILPKKNPYDKMFKTSMVDKFTQYGAAKFAKLKDAAKFAPEFATKKLDSFMTSAKVARATIKGSLMKFAPEFATKGLENLQKQGAKIAPFLTKQFDKVKGVSFSKIVDKINPKNIKFDGILNGLSGIKDKAMSIGGDMLKSFNSVKGQVVGTLGDMLSPMKNKVLGVGGDILKSVSNAFPKLTAMASKLSSKAASAAKSLMPKLPSIFGKGAGKAAAKTGGQGLLKSIGKKIPGIGAILGTGFAIKRLTEGDYLGAGMEMLSGVASTFPGLGTAVSLGIDAASIARDVSIEGKDRNEVVERSEDLAMNPAITVETPNAEAVSDQAMDISAIPQPAPSEMDVNVESDSGMNPYDELEFPNQDVVEVESPESTPMNYRQSIFGESSVVKPEQPEISAVNKNDAMTVTSPDVNVDVAGGEGDKITVDTGKLERLMMEMIKGQLAVANRPVHAVIGEKQLGQLQSEMRTRNAQS